MSLEDYPFDPSLRIEDLEGLDRLRCISDRGLARYMYDLFVALEPKWRDGTAARWLAEETREKEAKELDYLRALAERAIAGGLGEQAKQLAEHMLVVDGYKRQIRDDLRSLREFETDFRKLRRQ